MNIEGIDIKDIEFGEPIEKREPNYRDGYIRGIYRARNIIDSKQKEIERLNNIIKELRKMLEHKVEFHKNLDFYEDKELETQAYYNYVACLQDFDEIVEKYKLGK